MCMNKQKGRFSKFVLFYLIVSFFLVSAIPAKSFAYVADTGEVSFSETASRTADSAKIQRLLESKVVQSRLGELGLSSDEISQRLNRLSDSELHSFATRAEAIDSGKGGLGVVIGILVIIALVLVILHITEHRVVFEKTS